jgi:hypothetical protein
MLKNYPSKILCQACFQRKDHIAQKTKSLGKLVTNEFLNKLQFGNTFYKYFDFNWLNFILNF